MGVPFCEFDKLLKMSEPLCGRGLPANHLADRLLQRLRLVTHQEQSKPPAESQSTLLKLPFFRPKLKSLSINKQQGTPFNPPRAYPTRETLRFAITVLAEVVVV